MIFVSFLLCTLLMSSCSIDDSSTPKLGSVSLTGWPACVDSTIALADDLTPADFDYARWPVTNAEVRTVSSSDHLPTDISLVYMCDISPDTPEANQPGSPDPVGIALASVGMELYQILSDGSRKEIDKTASDHDAGKVLGYCHSINLPTDGSSIDVVLEATPYFYYLNKDGSANLSYATGKCNMGYFIGRAELSNHYSISQDDDGSITVLEVNVQ